LAREARVFERDVGRVVADDVWNGRRVVDGAPSGEEVVRFAMEDAALDDDASAGVDRVEKSALRRAGDFVRSGRGVSIVVGVRRCSIRLYRQPGVD
jgi:hypothetical protein